MNLEDDVCLAGNPPQRVLGMSEHRGGFMGGTLIRFLAVTCPSHDQQPDQYKDTHSPASYW
jgi:hypothetical protein